MGQGGQFADTALDLVDRGDVKLARGTSSRGISCPTQFRWRADMDVAKRRAETFYPECVVFGPAQSVND